jgi:hypothetical protein
MKRVVTWELECEAASGCHGEGLNREGDGEGERRGERV